MLYGKQLRSYLAYAVHGRKPIRLARTPQRNGRPRDEDYKAWIRTLSCVCCGHDAPNEAAHTGCDGGMSMKASDYSCVPLCASCHRTGVHAYHSADGKRKMEARVGRAFAEIAAELCEVSKRYGNPDESGMF